MDLDSAISRRDFFKRGAAVAGIMLMPPGFAALLAGRISPLTAGKTMCISAQ